MTGTFERAADLAWVDDGDRVVVLRLADLAAEPLMLVGPAAEIWRRLDSPVTLEALAGELAAEFAADHDLVSADVASFLGDATAAGAVLRRGAPA